MSELRTIHSEYLIINFLQWVKIMAQWEKTGYSPFILRYIVQYEHLTLSPVSRPAIIGRKQWWCIATLEDFGMDRWSSTSLISNKIPWPLSNDLVSNKRYDLFIYFSQGMSCKLNIMISSNSTELFRPLFRWSNVLTILIVKYLCRMLCVTAFIPYLLI